MRKNIIAASIASALALPGLAVPALSFAAEQSPHTVTGNLNFVTDYRFRGISQTFEQPAIQGGFDYSHSSGFYAGTWGSNVTGSLLNGPSYTNGNMEWDFYGGYKFGLGKDIGIDLGGIYYWYPDARYPLATKDKYDNFELYAGATWKWLSAKYYITTTDYFGTKTNTYGGYCGVQSVSGFVATPGTNCASATPGGSKGSGYLDVSATFEVGNGFNVVAHIGNQTVKNYSRFNYTDYKLGVTKDWVGFTWGAALVGTDANKDWWKAVKLTGTGFEAKDPGETTLVLSVGKTF